MEVILKKDVDNLGEVNDIVKVKPGYARNYLIPKGLAITANEINTKVVNETRKQQEQKREKMLDELRAIADKMNAASIKVGAKVGTSGKIFGAVTTHQLTEALKKETGSELDRKQVAISEEIKTVGKYKATVSLHKEVEVEIEFEVVPE